MTHQIRGDLDDQDGQPLETRADAHRGAVADLAGLLADAIDAGRRQAVVRQVWRDMLGHAVHDPDNCAEFLVAALLMLAERQLKDRQ